MNQRKGMRRMSSKLITTLLNWNFLITSMNAEVVMPIYIEKRFKKMVLVYTLLMLNKLLNDGRSESP